MIVFIDMESKKRIPHHTKAVQKVLMKRFPKLKLKAHTTIPKITINNNPYQI